MKQLDAHNALVQPQGNIVETNIRSQCLFCTRGTRCTNLKQNVGAKLLVIESSQTLFFYMTTYACVSILSSI